MQDIIQNATEHIVAAYLAGDHDEVLTAVDDLERQRGRHWQFDLLRGQVFIQRRCWRAAEYALTKVSQHVCDSPFCFSKTASVYLGSAALEQKKHLRAIGYLDRYLREFGDDLVVRALRGEVWAAQWRRTESQRDLGRAIGDLQSAYKLIETLPDNQVYAFQLLRLVAQDHGEEMISQCQHVIDAGEMRQFLRRSAPELVSVESADSLLGGVVSAEESRIDIGISLVDLLAAENAVRPAEGNTAEDILLLLKELLPICLKNSDAFYRYQAGILYMISAIHLEIHEERLDKNNMRHLTDAQDAFHDLLRLKGRYPLDELKQEIDTLERDIDQNRN